MSYSYGTPGKTEERCREQGNMWDGGVCKEVTVKDYCIDKLGEEAIAKLGTEETMLYECYEKIKLPKYKINQTLRYVVPPHGLLRHQRLDESQIDRAMELIGNIDKEENRVTWMDRSKGLVGHQRLTDKQIEDAARDGGVSLAKLYSLKKLPKKIIDVALESGKNVEEISRQGLNVRQMKRVIDVIGYRGLIGESNINYGDVPPEVIEYAVKKGDTTPNLYAYSTLPPTAIDEVMRLDTIHRELYGKLRGLSIDESKEKVIDHVIKHNLTGDELKAAEYARRKYYTLDTVYEYQNLSQKQVEAGIALGYHVPTLLSYQKISKSMVKNLVSELDYSTEEGKMLFNTLWANTKMTRELRKTLAEKAGIEGVISGDAHFVWSSIHPDNVPKLVEKMGAAVDKRLKENPLESLIGEYPIEMR